MVSFPTCSVHLVHADLLRKASQQPLNRDNLVATSIRPQSMDPEGEVPNKTDGESVAHTSSTAHTNGPPSLRPGSRRYALDGHKADARLNHADLIFPGSVEGPNASGDTDNELPNNTKADILLDTAEAEPEEWHESVNTEDSEATEILEGGFQSLRDPRQPLSAPEIHIVRPTPPRLTRHESSLFITGDISDSSEGSSPPPRLASTNSVSTEKSSSRPIPTAAIVTVHAAPISTSQNSSEHTNEQSEAQFPIIGAGDSTTREIEALAEASSPQQAFSPAQADSTAQPYDPVQATAPAQANAPAQATTPGQAQTPPRAATTTQEAASTDRIVPRQSQGGGFNPGTFRSRGRSRVRHAWDGSRSERWRILDALNRGRRT